MKTISFFTRTRSLIGLGMSAGLLMTVQGYAASHNRPGEDEPAAHKAKVSTSRNNNVVKIYPDIVKRDMHVIARHNDGKEIDFFVFDLHGTLVQNKKMKQRDHLKMSGMARGKYVYRVFAGDIETASGEFEIR